MFIFISTYRTQSDREKVIFGLQKFGLKVKILGACSNTTFEEAVNEVDYSDYRFFLAFENSLCEDYLTEKVYHALDASIRFGVVTVIYGGSDFSKFLPEKSYISATDFDNVDKLAQFLKSVIKDKTILKTYYQWQLDYEVVDYTTFNNGHYIAKFGWANLCKKLWETPSNEHKEIEKVRDHFGPCKKMPASFFNLTSVDLLEMYFADVAMFLEFMQISHLSKSQIAKWIDDDELPSNIDTTIRPSAREYVRALLGLVD